jgi:hypothetical protein
MENGPAEALRDSRCWQEEAKRTVSQLSFLLGVWQTVLAQQKDILWQAIAPKICPQLSRIEDVVRWQCPKQKVPSHQKENCLGLQEQRG